MSDELLPDVKRQRAYYEEELRQAKELFMRFQFELAKLEAHYPHANKDETVRILSAQGSEPAQFGPRKKALQETILNARKNIELAQQMLGELPEPEKEEIEEV